MHSGHDYNVLTFLLSADELLAEVRGDAIWIIGQVCLAIDIEEDEAFLLAPQLGLDGLRVHLHVAVLVGFNVHFILFLLLLK